MFLISGGHSFLPLDGPVPGKGRLEALSAAYTRLNYDLGLLTPDEARELRAMDVPLPANWMVQEDRVQTVVLSKGGVDLGLVIFPALQGPALAGPSEAQLREISQAAKALHGRASVVVGLSTWGLLAEQRMLDNSPPALDILLGSGRGMGLNGRLMSQNTLLWIRAFDKGKALQHIEVLTPPGEKRKKREKSLAWSQGRTISWTTLPLSEKIQSDPGLLMLFESLKK